MKVVVEQFLDETAHAPTQTLLDREFARTADAGRAIAAVADAAAARLALAHTGDARRAHAAVRHAGGALGALDAALWHRGEWRIDVFLTRAQSSDAPGGRAASAEAVAWTLAETIAVLRATIA